MVSFKYRLTEEEYYQFNYYTAWADPRKKKYRIIYFFRVILLYAVVAMLYIIATQSYLIWLDISVFVITGLTYLFLIPFFIKRSVKRKVADILSQKENEHVLEESEIILSDIGITDRDTVSESKYDWEAIVHLAETPDTYYLYTNSYHAIVIPKRAIGNVEDKNQTMHLFQRHLPIDA